MMGEVASILGTSATSLVFTNNAAQLENKSTWVPQLVSQFIIISRDRKTEVFPGQSIGRQ